MAPAIPEAELLAFLKAVEDGLIEVVPIEEPQEIYAGVVEYRASNGWRLAVFADANEWDYLEWVETPDGRKVRYAELDGSPLGNYQPPEETAWERYRIPGYTKFRCTVCGKFFKYRKDGLYRCSQCRRRG